MHVKRFGIIPLLGIFLAGNAAGQVSDDIELDVADSAPIKLQRVRDEDVDITIKLETVAFFARRNDR